MKSPQMIVGTTVHIRLSPKDMMGVCDVMEKSDAYVGGMSFASAVKLVLSGMLEGARESGQIPARDGFELSEMMGKYGAWKGGVKSKITMSMYDQELGREAAGMRPIVPKLHKQDDDVIATPEEIAKGKALRRYMELAFQWKHNKENMTPAERTELHTVASSLGMAVDESIEA